MPKKVAAVVIMGILLCGRLFSADVLGTYFDSDELDRRIRNYIVSVSNLIPDSTTQQNVWSLVPGDGRFYFGIGANGSFTFLERSNNGSTSGFGGSNLDLSTFPEAIPYLPGTAFDARFGMGRMDFGISGMGFLMDDNDLSNSVGSSFLGGGSVFSYSSFGIDARYTIIAKGVLNAFSLYKMKVPSAVPDITVQAGYFFTWIEFGIEAGRREKVDVDFRNDSYLLGVQATFNLPVITPYIGLKLIGSKTDSGFSWETDRPVSFRGELYRDGMRYTSGGKTGDGYAYVQIYGGLGLSYIYPHVVTAGLVFNPVTGHFGVNFCARYILGVTR